MKSALLNKELINLHQSVSTPPGTQLGYWATCDEALACGLWGRKVDPEGTSWVVALVNTGTKSHKITLEFSRFGGSWTAQSKATVTDLWIQGGGANSSATATGSYQATVPVHGTGVFKISVLS